MLIMTVAWSCRFTTLILVVSSALQCIALKYDPSKTYSYSYETDILLNDASVIKTSRPNKDVGAKLSMDFELSTIYQDPDLQIFKLLIVKAQASSIIRPEVHRDLSATLAFPVYFELSADTVGKLHFQQKDSVFGRNVKKGIVSLFQVREADGERTEVDVSGECQVTYAIPSPGVVERTKTDCKNLEIAGQFSSTNKALGISMWIKASQRYEIKDSVISSVTGTQRVITYLNLRAALNGEATSSQKLQLLSSKDGSAPLSSTDQALEAAEKEAGSKLEMSLLPSEEEILHCTQGCESPKDIASKLGEDLKPENIATLKSAKAFIQMLKAFRGSGKDTIAGIFTSSESYYIIHQLIDIATAAQTEASREALFDLLDFENADAVDYPQRFLFAAAYSSHPSMSLISDLLSVLKKPIPNEGLHESLLLSLGAVVHTFCQVREQATSPVVEEFKTLVVNGLKACTEDPCRLMYIRSLGNAGLASTVPVILPYAESPSNPMVATTAIAAFRRMHSDFISQQVKDSMLRIFHQNKATYDSSVRVAALEVLLAHQPTAQVLRNVYLACLDQSNSELSTYIIRLLADSVSSNPALRDQMSAIMKDTRMNNYNTMAQKGKSSTVTSNLAKMKDANSTYNLYFENAPSGVMKRSGMVVSLLGKNLKQQIIKFGIYADGLESIMGESSEEAEDGSADETNAQVEPTAGMAFSFMDVLLTQVEFFKGTSGLMSAVWNAPSELTSALQGNILLQDHAQLVHLSNGLVLDTSVMGALSMDLSGFVSISLWNRNCESLIRTSGAMYVEGSLRVDSKELDIGLTFSGEGQSNIDFTSDVDFYEMPVKACAEMKRPEFEFIQSVKKEENIKEKTKKYRSRRSKKLKASGESYFLNKANSQECRLMMKEE